MTSSPSPAEIMRPKTTAQSAPGAAVAASENTRGVTRRVMVICLALAAFFATIIPVIDYRFGNTYLGASHLPPGAIAALLIMLGLVNPALALLGERWKLSRNEVLTIYITCLFSCLVPGMGNNYLVPFILGVFYAANKQNGWLDFLGHLPPWMTPALKPDGSYNKALVDGWFQGIKPDEAIPWTQWATPLLAWGALFTASFIMLGCLSVMLRAQWGEREALSFPLLRLPLELTEERDEKTGKARNLLRDSLMWYGFGIAVVIQLLNGLNVYFPDVPRIVLDLNTSTIFTEAPWNQIGRIVIKVWPMVVGITYLLTSEISFSLWFFYWFMKFQTMGALYCGYPPALLPTGVTTDQKLFQVFQEVGAHVMLVAMILWAGREHFTHIAQRAFGRTRARDGERGEALSYPVAFWGFLLSFLFMVGWTVCAGVHPVLALALWLSYLVIAVVLTRVVVGGGLLFIAHAWMPVGTFTQLLGSGPGTLLSPAHGIVQASVLDSMCIQDYRASLMPSFVQSFKLAHDRGIAQRPLLGLIAAVVMISLVVGLCTSVRLGYQTGGLTMQGWWLTKGGPIAMGKNAQILTGAAPNVSWLNWLWMAVGAVITYGLSFAQSRFLGFPLHPLGYVMALSYSMTMFWFSIFTGWLIKSLIMRFGGIESYRKLTPAFLGLVLGDVSMMLFWLLVDGWQGRMNHQLMPS